MNYDHSSSIRFNCNICGSQNFRNFLDFHREVPDCNVCGSTPRFRGIINALSVALYGKSIIAKDFPVDKTVKGVGMSDWDGYASILEEKFDFQNTFYDVAPKLDVTSSDWMHYADCDFVLCTEVLEHIPSPFHEVPHNIKRMLKPTGVLIFSTPYTNRPVTKEHFPGLRNFVCVEIDGSWVVVNKNVDATYTVFDQDICFHGGPGTVLEMRVFSEKEVVSMLFDAGYVLKIYDQVIPEIGYAWPSYEHRIGDGIGLDYIIEAKPIRY